MSDEKFQNALNGLYHQMLAPSKTKFVAEVRKRIANGSLKGAPRNWLSEVSSFLDGVNASVFQKPVERMGHYEYGSVDFALVTDLMDCSMMNPKKNKGYNWVLVIMDGSSRYAWVWPLKTKSSLETDKEGNNAIAKAFKEVFSLLIPGYGGSKDYPKGAISPTVLVVSDRGSEFLGEVSKVIDSYVYASRRFTAPHRKSTELAERFILTLRQALTRIMNIHDGQWYPYLQQVVANYNGEKHSGIGGEIPVDALMKRVLDIQEGISHAVIDLDLPERQFPDGSEVRLLLNYDVFAKKSLAQCGRTRCGL